MKKNIEIALLFGLIFTIVLSTARFNAACDDLRSNVLRLHIIANSDSAVDQNVKILVRDKILEQAGYIFENNFTLEEAEEKATESLQMFEDIANRVIKENGLNYSSKAEIAECYFENREYEDFTLPAGNYNSLIVRLGEGKGQNWWCVVFPSVCLPAASNAELSDTVSETGAEVANESKKYVIRFKAIEWYEEIKRLIND